MHVLGRQTLFHFLITRFIIRVWSHGMIFRNMLGGMSFDCLTLKVVCGTIVGWDFCSDRLKHNIVFRTRLTFFLQYQHKWTVNKVEIIRQVSFYENLFSTLIIMQTLFY